MVGRPPIQLDKTVLKNMYEDGIKLKQISRYFGMSIHKIQNTRNDLHLPRRIRKVVNEENEFKRLFQSKMPYNEMAK